ncbi:CheR family methyltransferase [Thiohalobacter thiocyanaticus]|nr:protein-glutamate O-methyltransferase CheR [Thiohalobacter thiocyanaticus]
MANRKLPSRTGLPELSDAQFGQWRELLETRMGISLSEQRKPLFVSGLRARMREIGCEDYQAYYQRLRAPHSMPEWAILIDRLTVHETRFFRDPDALDLVERVLLPGFAGPGGRSLQAWSLGCASGEEAYTLAMLLDRALTTGPDTVPRFGITATDISRPALDTARQGEYAQRRLAGIPQEYRQTYCETLSPQRFRISERLRRRICFSPLNLSELERFPLDGFDLIYCQNVLIYFDRGERHGLLDRLAGRLAPGGLLVLAPGDVLSWTHPALERIRCAGTLAYQRRVDPEARD